MEKPLKRTEKLIFLGYEIQVRQKLDTKIELSQVKITRYIDRIESSIKSYNIDSKFNEKIARRILFDRLKFLTGNYHLNHNKKNIKAGILYSNEMLQLNKKKIRFDSLGVHR